MIAFEFKVVSGLQVQPEAFRVAEKARQAQGIGPD